MYRDLGYPDIRLSFYRRRISIPVLERMIGPWPSDPGGVSNLLHGSISMDICGSSVLLVSMHEM